MHRIQSWFDQLALGRQSRRTSRRRRVAAAAETSSSLLAGKNARRVASPDAPRVARNAADRGFPHRAASHSVVRHELKPVAVPIVFPPPPPPPPLDGSFPRRNRIRTNPWVGEAKSLKDGSLTLGRTNTEYRRPPPTLCVASPDTSVCSSGYGSHDSSPDTSMVWSSSGEWKSSWKHCDNLEAADVRRQNSTSTSTPMTDSSCSVGTSSSLSPPCSPANMMNNTNNRSSKFRAESPIYAEPWTHYRMQPPPAATATMNTSSSSPRTPLVVRNASFRPPRSESPIYAQPYATLDVRPPHRRGPVYGEPFYGRHPPSERLHGADDLDDDVADYDDIDDDDDDARDEFLFELDVQIHELQLRSEELRELVERARSQRKEFIIPRLECTFELAI